MHAQTLAQPASRPREVQGILDKIQAECTRAVEIMCTDYRVAAAARHAPAGAQSAAVLAVRLIKRAELQC
jgi:hypothetical protein